MIGHLRASSLARYRAGDLGHRRSAAVRRHLDRCGRCRELSAGLEAVTAALASVPAPPLPGHLLARIEDALTAEATRRAAAAAAARGAAEGPGRPADAARTPLIPGRPEQPERRRHPRRRGPSDRAAGHGRRAWLPGHPAPAALRLVTAAAAAVAVLAGAGVGIWQATRPPAVPAHGAGSGGRNAASVPQRGAAPAAGGALTLPYRLNGRPSTITVRSSGRNYQPGSLGRAVSKELAAGQGRSLFGQMHTHAAPTRPAGAAGSGAAAMLSPVRAGRLAGCVSRLAAGHRVLLIDLGYYRGRPATVVAIRSPGAQAVTVWVVGPACSATRGDVLAHTTVPG